VSSLHRASIRQLTCVLFILSLALTNHSISFARSKRRELRISGPIVAYKGGSGAGTYTLLVRGRFRTFSYAEPIPWRRLKRIEDIYLGSIIAARFHRLRRGYRVTAIEIIGTVNKDIRLLWETITAHFEALARRDYKAAYAEYLPKLQGTIPFASFEREYSSASFDVQPIIIVQPNPLTRYGIIAYGINLREYKGSTATVRVELRHFIHGLFESKDYHLIRTSGGWRISAITEAD